MHAHHPKPAPGAARRVACPLEGPAWSLAQRRRCARARSFAVGLATALLALAAESSRAAEPGVAAAPTSARYAAGSTTFCVVDPSRGFDEAGGVREGQRLLVVEAWYPVDPQAVTGRAPSQFGDYFAGDRELLLRTERALLSRSGIAGAALEANLELAKVQFDVPRGSHRNATLARGDQAFPLVIYSHGTLQQRFSNDALAEKLAQNGYIVLAPEHTGNDALAPLGTFCKPELARPGVTPASLAENPNFDAAHGDYSGQRLEPFFVVGSPRPESGTISPVEVALTLDRVADYRAVLQAARQRYGGRVALGSGSVGLVGYSRGAMHGLVGAELLPEIGASVSIVGGTPLGFYARDAQAAPINSALSKASRGKRRVLDHLTKPVLEIIGAEDTRRKATSDVAASIGVYPTPSASNPSPIVKDSLARLGPNVFGALVRVNDLEHGDLVDDPFVIAYRAPAGQKRPGAFDPKLSYTSRPVAERQAIRDYFVLALLERFIRPGAARPAPVTALPNPFAARGVQVELRASKAAPAAASGSAPAK